MIGPIGRFNSKHSIQYVVMICACVYCRMKFAVAVVCLLMLNILVSVCGRVNRGNVNNFLHFCKFLHRYTLHIVGCWCSFMQTNILL